MLEEMLDDPIQLEMIKTSANKAEYEQKLIDFAKAAGQGSVVSFTETEMILTVNGQQTAKTQYIVRDGAICFLPVGGSQYMIAYFITDENNIYEHAEDSYTSTTHYWVLQ